jgi:hypothetical protein
MIGSLAPAQGGGQCYYPLVASAHAGAPVSFPP